MKKSVTKNREKSVNKQFIKKESDIHKMFQHGLSLHQHGQLVEAKKIYEQVIEKQSNHFDALHMLGVILTQTGHPNAAVMTIKKAISINANFPTAHSHLGMALSNLNRLDDALASYEKAITIRPDYAEAYNSRGNVLKRLSRIEDALDNYEKAIALKPNYAEAFNNRGTALQELGRTVEALASYDKAIALKPAYAEAFNNRGTSLQELNQKEEALASYDQAIAINPKYAEVFNNRGNILEEIGRPEEAIANYDKAIALRTNYAEAFNNRGTALQRCHRLEDVLASYETALKINPYYVEALNNYGNILKEFSRHEDALASYNKAIAIKPNYIQALINRGTLLQELNLHEEALKNYDLALSFNQDCAEAFNNRGTALQQLNRIDEALSSYGKALALKPDYSEALINRGAALHVLNRLEEALYCYEKAILIDPNNIIAFMNRGNIFKKLRRPEEALDSYERAYTIQPEHPFLLGSIIHSKMHICDWSALDLNLKKLLSSIEDGKKAANPFVVLGLIDNPKIQKKSSIIYSNDNVPNEFIHNNNRSFSINKKIRIAYYSSDFYNHATLILMSELFESHDKNIFELYAFSYGENRKDEMRERAANSFDYFIDVSQKSDSEIAEISKSLSIDIAIDLKGYTENSRFEIFKYKIAPIQINYLGYPGTLGLSCYDYIIADNHIIPTESQHHYSEKIIYLPNSYQPNDSNRIIAKKNFSRSELGLPENGFIFCSFNNNYKILPYTFDVWMRLLDKVEGSVLWLLEDNSAAKRNLLREAEIRGINPSRLIFAPRIKLENHLARHKVADLFLDTLPYNAHTTASDALWAGLPVLTQTGQSFAGRVAGSLLKALNLPELITSTTEEYETKAIELANDRAKLLRIKEKIENNRLTSPLFNGKIYARNIEAAYLECYRMHLNNERPDHIYIGAL